MKCLSFGAVCFLLMLGIGNAAADPYPGACYVEWRAWGVTDREAHKQGCAEIPGIIEFKFDNRSGRNICIFRPT
jgi:hypothetical protein